MNILINGGIGFIGHNLVRELQKRKHNIVIYDYVRYPTMDLHQLNSLIGERIKTLLPGYNLFSADIIEGQTQDKIFSDFQPKIVVHCAGCVSQEIIDFDPIYAARSMVEGVLRVLQIAHKNKVQKFVYISSSMVYGDFVDGVREDALCLPTNVYGTYKHLAEVLIKDFCSKHKMKYTIIRPTALYGPRDSNNRLISKFFLEAKNNKKLVVNGKDEKLDFTYIDDFINGCTNAILRKNFDNKIYNISYGVSVPIVDVANMIVKLVGSGKVQVADKQPYTPSRGSLDNELAKTDFEHNPVVNIEKGLHHTYEWIRNSVFWT